jgi:hypothetical protein
MTSTVVAALGARPPISIQCGGVTSTLVCSITVGEAFGTMMLKSTAVLKRTIRSNRVPLPRIQSAQS